TTHVLPAGGTFSLPLTVDPNTLSLDIDLAWGTSGDPVDLDIAVLDSAGREIARSGSINGAGLFGRTEGVHLTHGLDGALTVNVTPKATTVGDEPFYLRRQAARGDRIAYPDVDPLPSLDRDAVARAIFGKMMIGSGGLFEPQRKLSRAELARSLSLTSDLPQR